LRRRSARAQPRAQPPRVAHGLNSHTACAIGGWSRGPRRRSDEGCVKRLTPQAPPGPKKSIDGASSLFARKHTARKLPRGSTFQGCYWGPSGGVLVAFGTRAVLSGQSLGSRPRASNRRKAAGAAAAAALQSPGPGRLSLEPLLVIPVRSNQEPLFLGINSNNN